MFRSPRARLSIRSAAASILAVVVGLGLGTRSGSVFAQAKPAADPVAAREASQAQFKSVVAPFFAEHCNACHSAKKSEGDLALETLDPDMQASTSAGRWALLLDKVVMGEMPPEGSPRPAAADLAAVTSWIHAEMKRSGKHVARRAAYANGNLVPHDLLFGAKAAAPFDSPARLRRLSPEIYAGFVAGVAKGFDGLIGQPFSPEGKTTFADMGDPKIDEPVTMQLLRNAVTIAERHTGHTIKDGQVVPMVHSVKDLLPLVDESVPLTDELIAKGIAFEYGRLFNRPPTKEESERYAGLIRRNVADAGRVAGVRYGLAAIFLSPEAVYRWELGTGTPDAQGRVRLTGREIAEAVSFALLDRRPDGPLLSEADQGKLDTPQGVAQVVRRILDDPKADRPRIPRFFREYFGYEKAKDVAKEEKEFPDHDVRALVEDTDRLVQTIVAEDRNVLAELLTTNRTFVAHKSAAETKKRRADELAKFEEGKKKEPEKFKNKTYKPPGKSVYETYGLTDFPDEQPTKLPAGQRAGILTQPAWLVAWSQPGDNHAILRGKWVRERLLGGVVPDVPITVDAQLPVAPEKTLRERMAVTQQAYCWKCHQSMNDVGLPFEMYDHFGRYRTEELGKPVDAKGKIALAGHAPLEGDVTNAVDLMQKLAASERVEQVFVRHVFRYFLGRNETLGDAPTLQAAHRAYRESGGSFKALVASLLSSESFLHRVPSTTQAAK